VLACSSGLALAQSETAGVLPVGTTLTFVSDATVDPKTVGPGRVFKVHLRDDLVLAGTMLAATGTLAQLVVLDRVTEVGGAAAIVIAVGGFNVRGGELPVTPVRPTISAIVPGTLIATRTMGSVEERNGRTMIRVPLPFALPADKPHAAYTPVPARTANPRIVSPPPRGVRRPSPTPSPTPEATPTPEPTPEP